jgi:hypothetical protein
VCGFTKAFVVLLAGRNAAAAPQQGYLSQKEGMTVLHLSATPHVLC